MYSGSYINMDVFKIWDMLIQVKTSDLHAVNEQCWPSQLVAGYWGYWVKHHILSFVLILVLWDMFWCLWTFGGSRAVATMPNNNTLTPINILALISSKEVAWGLQQTLKATIVYHMHPFHFTSKWFHCTIMQHQGLGVHKVIKRFSNYYWPRAKRSMQISGRAEAMGASSLLSRKQNIFSGGWRRNTATDKNKKS